MTPQEAVDFAEGLEPPNVYSMQEAFQGILNVLETVTTPRQRQKALETLCANAEHFRRTDTPGHRNWYPHHLRTAATAAQRWTQ